MKSILSSLMRSQWKLLLISLNIACFWPVASVLAEVTDIVSQVSVTSYRQYLDQELFTHLGDNRGFGAEHDLARDNIFSAFSSFGLDTHLEAFTYNSATYYNVIGMSLGTVRPDDIYLVGAHFDSFGNPGADDNASGVAGVLEAARVLSQYQFEATLVFAAFDREEQGLEGSFAYVQSHLGANILGMVSLDMIAYNGPNPEVVNLYGRPASDPLKYEVGDALTQYGGLSYTALGPWDASDHAPFEWAGYPAVLVIESVSNPYYHTSLDSVDTPNYVDYDYAAQITRGVVGWMSANAAAVPDSESGTLFVIVLLSVLGGHYRWMTR